MAGRNVTTTVGNGPARDWHHGNQVSWNFETGNTKFGSTSDQLVLAKIPSGSEILDFFTRFATTDAQSVVRAELQTSAGVLLAVVAAPATVSAGAGGAIVLRPGIGSVLPYMVSLSDDAPVRYANLVLNVQSGTETVSVSVGGWVSYSRNSK